MSAERLQTVVDEPADELDIEAGFDGVSPFLIRPAQLSDPLPLKAIEGVHVAEIGLYDLMQMLLADTGYSLTIEGGPNASERYRSVAAFNLSGPLASVVDHLSETIGFFYRVSGRYVLISPERMFVMDLPPSLMEDNISGMVNTMQYFGAKDVYVDHANRTVTFRADRPVLRDVEAYLDQMRRTRSMLVYELQVYQVDLHDNNQTGIGWNKITHSMEAAADASRSVTLTRGGSSGFGAGAIIVGRHFTVDMLVDFLQTQGTVRAVSQPRITMVTGTSGTLRVGQTSVYVARVTETQSIGSAVPLSRATAETKELRTGFELKLQGDYHDRTIYTTIDLKVSDLIRYDKHKTLGVELNLPTTVDREVGSIVRARPGDLILLGGLTTSRDVASGNFGVAGVDRQEAALRSELVVALRSRVVTFSGNSRSDSAVNR